MFEIQGQHKEIFSLLTLLLDSSLYFKVCFLLILKLFGGCQLLVL